MKQKRCNATRVNVGALTGVSNTRIWQNTLEQKEQIAVDALAWELTAKTARTGSRSQIRLSVPRSLDGTFAGRPIDASTAQVTFHSSILSPGKTATRVGSSCYATRPVVFAST
jgi:hypothetical protein